jgi:hypothetical protein
LKIQSPEIQKLAADMYHNAIEVEYEENKSQANAFPKVETFTIDTLDKMSSKEEGGISNEFMATFLNS